MQVKLVNSTSVKVGNKLLRGNRVVTVTEIINITKNHFTIICDDDLVFTRSDLKLLKVLEDGALA